MIEGQRVGTIQRMSEAEKQLLYAYRDLVLYSEKHRKHLNKYNDFESGYQFAIDICRDKVFSRVRKTLEI